MPDLLSSEKTKPLSKEPFSTDEEVSIPKLPEFEDESTILDLDESQTPNPKTQGLTNETNLDTSTKSKFLMALGIIASMTMLGLGALALYMHSASFIFSTGLKQSDSGNFEAAFETFSSLANEGHVEAKTHLGLLYYHGDGVDQDKLQAFSWFKQASEAGSSEAQNAIGQMYLQGDGVETDKNKGKVWLQKAAENGFNPAIETLRLLQSPDPIKSP